MLLETMLQFKTTVFAKWKRLKKSFRLPKSLQKKQLQIVPKSKSTQSTQWLIIFTTCYLHIIINSTTPALKKICLILYLLYFLHRW